MADSPVQPVTFGQALNISLDNYYDLLKANVGTLNTDEHIQLKLAADAVDISTKKYLWFSYYNLLKRSDMAIDPKPVADAIGAAGATLAQVYERFLRKLRTYVVQANLSPDEQKQVQAFDIDMDGVRTELTKWYILDRTTWKQYADAMGYSVGDNNAYLQWSIFAGHTKEIQRCIEQLNTLSFQQRTILNKQYPEPTDREVVDAEADFYSSTMRIRYPLSPDYLYDNGDRFSLTYLANLPLGSSGLFDDRRVISWDKSIDFLQQTTAGSLSASFDRTTSTSATISSDWGASSSGGWAFIRVNASASDLTQIQNDFSKGTSIALSAAAAFRVNITYPNWFRPTLFSHKRVLDNAQDFVEFLGSQGSLLYFPTGLLLVRGFKTEFTSSQSWTYDYRHKFSASGGGGFNAFGISFGSSGSYQNEQKEHSVDVSNTKLTITDDPSTVRFVGYAVKKNTAFHARRDKQLQQVLGDNVASAFDRR